MDNSASGAVYKGLALGSNANGNFLFATNFHAGTIDVFDSSFNPVTLAPGAFTDPHLAAGYAPFGIRNINGDLYVTYAKQNAEKHDDVAGMGHGFVDIYDTSGNLLQRLITRGQLNSPWGLTLAPASFGEFANDLLVGNFGNGRINAYDPTTGEFLGRLGSSPNNPISINGLWSLSFGNDGAAGPSSTLFFTAGLNDEADGLFGSIQPAASMPSGKVAATHRASSHTASAAALMATFIRDGRPGQSTTASPIGAFVVSPAGASTGGHSTVIPGSFTEHGATNLSVFPPHPHATGNAAQGAIDALFAALGDRPFERT